LGDLIIEWSGTPAGEALALVLAILSAMAHAIFGAINKSGADPYLNRGAINICYSLMAMPFALFVFPWPDLALFKVLCLTYILHLVYEWLQTVSFAKGAFTVVYPIARGTGPFIIALGAMIIFNEHMEVLQWFGLGILSASIFLLAFVNYRIVSASGLDISGLRQAVTAAFFTGVMIAIYTTVDAYGIRMAADPFTFLSWFFLMGGFGFPLIAARRWIEIDEHPPISDLAIRGIFGAIIGIISFGSIMMATRLGKVAEAAALRETSIIFGTGIGVLIFKEKIRLPALLLIGFIALGAILVTAA
jgi:drug/metabolite transporter (DMT)-like permease